MATVEQPRDMPGRLSFLRGVFFTGSGSAMNLAFLFLETMIAVRLLPTDSYGIYVLLVTVVGFCVIMVDFGCKTATTQFIASSNRDRQAAVANSAVVFRAVLVAAISAAIWLGQDLLILLDPSRALMQYTGYIPLMLVVASLDELFLGMLQGFQAYRQMAIAQIVRSVLRLGLTIALLAGLKLGLLALVLSWTISFAVSVVYQYLALPFSKRLAFDRPLLGEMLRFGLPVQVTRLLWFVFRRIDVLLLGTLAGPASVAYYAVAARIPDALQNLSESYTAVFFPTMSALLGAGKRQQAGWVLHQSLRLISFAAAVGTLTAVLFSQEIVTLLFSEKYAASSLAFALLMLALHMTLLDNLMGYTLTSAGFPGRALGENLTRTTLNVLGDLALIPVLSFLGPAWATLAAAYGANPVVVWLLRRSDIAVAVGPYVKQTGLLLLCAGLFWWIQPAGFPFKVSILVLFVTLNVALSTITRDDVSLVLPRDLVKRPGRSKGFLPDGH